MKPEHAQRIRTILLTKPRSIFRTNHRITYKEVVRMWKKYKCTQINMIVPTPSTSCHDDAHNDYIVPEILAFHKEQSTDHIIMYYALGNINCLLLCKISGKYIQSLLPQEKLHLFHKNFIAVYHI